VTRVGAGGGQMASGRCAAKSPYVEAGRSGARVKGEGPPERDLSGETIVE
jgi:hypothetical protein